MQKYQLIDAQGKHFYSCFPELVIYDTQSKKTILLSSCAAKLMNRFILGRKKDHFAELELKKYCYQEGRFSPEVVELSIEQLLKMKIIELVQ